MSYSIPDSELERIKPQISRIILSDPGFRQQLEEKIRTSVLGLAGPDQVQNVSINFEYAINNREASLNISVSLGELTGNYEVEVQSHSRSNSEVIGHSRSYSGSRPFQLPDGRWVTLDHVPKELAQEKIIEALGQINIS